MGYPYAIQKNIFKALGAPNNWQHCILMLHWLAMVIKEEQDMIFEDQELEYEEDNFSSSNKKGMTIIPKANLEDMQT